MDKITSAMHKVMREDPFTLEICGAIDISMMNFKERIEMFRNQLDIDTATWALDIYEGELGITIDRTKPIDQRRSVIKSKIRGSGKIGAAQIKLVADSYTNGDVEVSLEQGIRIEFTSVFGVPANLDDLKVVLRTIVPAHLTIGYTFRYVLYKDLKGRLYRDLKTKTYAEIFNGGI